MLLIALMVVVVVVVAVYSLQCQRRICRMSRCCVLLLPVLFVNAGKENRGDRKATDARSP